MTREQMDKVVQAYCGNSDCRFCRIKELCEPILGDFLGNPATLKVAYDIVSAVPENDCCTGCFHEGCELHEYPCVKCKANTLHSDPNYENTPYLWTPIDNEVKEVPVTESDPVTHPSHYTQGNIQCIDAMEAAFGKEQVAIWCKLNAFKYIWREEHKNGLQDIDKAIWYLNKFKELKASG